jgi:hypothetical protein
VKYWQCESSSALILKKDEHYERGVAFSSPSDCSQNHSSHKLPAPLTIIKNLSSTTMLSALQYFGWFRDLATEK